MVMVSKVVVSSFFINIVRLRCLVVARFLSLRSLLFQAVLIPFEEFPDALVNLYLVGPAQRVQF